MPPPHRSFYDRFRTPRSQHDQIIDEVPVYDLQMPPPASLQTDWRAVPPLRNRIQTNAIINAEAGLLNQQNNSNTSNQNNDVDPEADELRNKANRDTLLLVAMFVMATSYILATIGDLITKPGSCFIQTNMVFIGGIFLVLSPCCAKNRHNMRYFSSPLVKVGFLYITFSFLSLLINIIPKFWNVKTEFVTEKEFTHVCDGNGTVKEVSLVNHVAVVKAVSSSFCIMMFAIPLLTIALIKGIMSWFKESEMRHLKKENAQLKLAAAENKATQPLLQRIRELTFNNNALMNSLRLQQQRANDYMPLPSPPPSIPPSPTAAVVNERISTTHWSPIVPTGLTSHAQNTTCYYTTRRDSSADTTETIDIVDPYPGQPSAPLPRRISHLPPLPLPLPPGSFR